MLIGQAVAQSQSRPLKIVQFTKGGYTLLSPSPLDYVKMMHASCSAVPGKSPVAFPKTLTEDYLVKEFGITETRLWQGSAQAKFFMDRSFSVDLAKNCAVIQHTTYRSEVAVDCVSLWTGSNDGEDALKINDVYSGKGACLSNGESEPKMKNILSTAKLKTLAKGFECLYNDGQKWSGVSFCLYPKMPYYMNNPGRPVSFTEGVFNGLGNSEVNFSIKEISDGNFTVPPEQFTKAAIKAWINQPALVYVK